MERKRKKTPEPSGKEPTGKRKIHSKQEIHEEYKKALLNLVGVPKWIAFVSTKELKTHIHTLLARRACTNLYQSGIYVLPKNRNSVTTAGVKKFWRERIGKGTRHIPPIFQIRNELVGKYASINYKSPSLARREERSFLDKYKSLHSCEDFNFQYFFHKKILVPLRFIQMICEFIDPLEISINQGKERILGKIIMMLTTCFQVAILSTWNTDLVVKRDTLENIHVTLLKHAARSIVINIQKYSILERQYENLFLRINPKRLTKLSIVACTRDQKRHIMERTLETFISNDMEMPGLKYLKMIRMTPKEENHGLVHLRRSIIERFCNLVPNHGEVVVSSCFAYGSFLEFCPKMRVVNSWSITYNDYFDSQRHQGLKNYKAI